MTLTHRLTEYISACFTGLWIQSHEHDDALTEIAKLCRDQNWRLAVWDIASGLQIPGQNTPADAGGSDPLAAIRSINALASADSSAILVLANFHRFLSSPEIIQALAKQISTGKANRTFIVVLSPIVQIPAELEKHFVVLDHDLPGRDQLEQIARSIATEEDDLPQGDDLNTVLDAAAGLTRYEAEGAFSLSIVRHGNIRPDAIWELKSQTLKKSGLLQLHRGGESFDGLGGLQSLKSFTLRAMRRQGHRDPLRRPRGVLLLGVPGTGKSAFAKSLGSETGRPTLILDIGSLMGSLVGSTEANIRQALKIIDAMEPCICFVDEVEKALSGVSNSGDSGVSARLFGTFLTWLNHYVVLLRPTTYCCMLEIRRKFTICRDDCPAVLEGFDLPGPLRDHRLDGQDQSRPEHDPLPRLTPVGDLRLLVHLLTDPMPDQGPDDPVPWLSACSWTAWPISESRLPFCISAMPSIRHSCVTRIRRSAAAETVPTPNVTAESET